MFRLSASKAQHSSVQSLSQDALGCAALYMASLVNGVMNKVT